MTTRAERRRQLRQGEDPSRPTTGRNAGIAVAIVAVIGIAAYAVWQSQHVSSSAVQTPDTFPSPAAVGTKAIPFEIDSPIGPFTSTSLAGKPYLLEIFATWCPHCQRETKVLKAVRAKIPMSKLAMLSVSGSLYGEHSAVGANEPESQAGVEAFDKEYGVTWPALYDANLTVARLWGMFGFPTIYIVDKSGVIRYAGSGDQDAATLMAGLKKAGV